MATSRSHNALPLFSSPLFSTPPQVHADLLWVFADGSGDGWLASAATPMAAGMEGMGVTGAPDDAWELKQVTARACAPLTQYKRARGGPVGGCTGGCAAGQGQGRLRELSSPHAWQAHPNAPIIYPRKRVRAQPWFQRDTPVGLDLLFENFLDPVSHGVTWSCFVLLPRWRTSCCSTPQGSSSRRRQTPRRQCTPPAQAHVPYSHHGVIGRRDTDTRMEMMVDESRGGITKDAGFLVNATNAFEKFTVDLQPPCRVR